jgi:hypothetical protein
MSAPDELNLAADLTDAVNDFVGGWLAQRGFMLEGFVASVSFATGDGEMGWADLIPPDQLTRLTRGLLRDTSERQDYLAQCVIRERYAEADDPDEGWAERG